ncbi:hypothetical protein MMC07_002544 [Pseudocyphellaria aurata]|nr:hypothetical protein [Pseudocyphellaria aurata]
MAHHSNHHGDSGKLGGEARPKAGEKEEGKEAKRKASRPPITYHSLRRTWPTEANPSGRSEPQRLTVAGTSAAMQRWTGEAMREQPWNGVGSFSTSSSKEK